MAGPGQALQDAQLGLKMFQEPHREDTDRLFAQGVRSWDLFWETNQLEDIDEAIEYFRQALTLNLNDIDHASFLHEIGVAYKDRFLKTNELVDLDTSTSCHRQTLELAQINDRQRSRSLFGLGTNFMSRFKRNNDMLDLDQASQHHLKALDVLPSGDLKARAESSYCLGVVFRNRFGKTKIIDDLKQSIRYHKQALQDLPAGDIKFGKCLGMLGVSFGLLFEELNDPNALDESIACYMGALRVLSGHHPDRTLCLGNLGLSFGDRFERTDRLADLDRFIRYMQKAYAATPISNNKARVEHLGNLGVALVKRFKRTGQLTDLEQSIQNFQQALTGTPPNDPAYLQALNNLGTGFADRYERTHHRTDLEQCLTSCREVLKRASVDDPQYVVFLNNLGQAYGAQFQRTGRMADLDDCISYHQQATDLVSANHPERPRCYALLGTRFGFRYRRTHDMADLEKNIKYSRQAVESFPAWDADRVPSLSLLALALAERFAKTDQTNDIDESIKFSQQAVEATLEDNPQRARYLFLLGIGLTTRSRGDFSSKDFRTSIQAFNKALSHSAGFPLVRIAAGIFAVDNLLEAEKWNDASDMLGEILELLTDLTLPTNSRDDLQHTLKMLSELSSLSASAFLKAGKSPVEALQALEQARGIIGSYLMESRSDISMLKENYPELSSRYTNCRREIAAIDLESGSAIPDALHQNYATKSGQLQKLFQNLHKLREEIRQCPGFERFLMALTEEEIRELATAGPVICFNVSKISSEAFLITTAGIQALPLPALRIENLRRQVRLFSARGNPTRRDGSVFEDDEDEALPASDLSTVLRELWVDAVKPVLQQVGFLAQDQSPNQLPRIWWVGGGIMALLPLHAAGDHTPGSSENTLSHTITSYAPTLRSLQYIRSRPAFTLGEQRPEFLIVSMPTTAGQYRPLEVAEEVASIVKSAGSVTSITHLERPMRQAVLTALESCAIAHFACHGRVDGSEPAKSGLIVGRDTEESLTIADLDRVALHNAQIVYLSACSTAEMQALQLVHESVHLASAFQLSGFQHVIGTLWGADDSAAVKIASDFYRLLLQRDHVGGSAVALALHDAVLAFRNTDDNHKAVSQWASFIHLGC